MKANKQLSDNLQAVLVDLIELHLQTKQAHWNVVGINFRDTHLILDEVTDAARELSDEVAERMRALHALPDGRSETVSTTSTLAKFSEDQVDTAEVVTLITARLDAAAATCRRVHDEVDEADPTTADLLHKVIETLEQYAWMVSAESLKPRKRNATTGLSDAGETQTSVKGERLRIRWIEVDLAGHLPKPSGSSKVEHGLVKRSPNPGASPLSVDNDAIHVQEVHAPGVKKTIVFAGVFRPGVHPDHEANQSVVIPRRESESGGSKKRGHLCLRGDRHGR